MAAFACTASHGSTRTRPQEVRDDKIFHVASAFDGRPFAALFEGAKKK